MKKYLFILFLFVFVNLFLWTQNYKQAEILPTLNMDEFFYSYDYSYDVGKKDDSFIVWNLNHGIKINKENIYKDNYNYSCFYYESEKHIILYGSNFLFIFKPSYWGTIKTLRVESISDYYNKIKKFNDKIDWHSSRESGLEYIDLSNFDIKNIFGSSIYKEKTKTDYISYSPDFLNLIVENCFTDSKFLLRNPWVPGKEKNPSGIGEYLEIEFTKPKNNLVVLNGFVDLEKRYLYKANNRVKKAVVTSLDKDNPFEIEYEFEDYVHFSEINFPKAVNKVRFTIKEVYKGEKWDDTCIQAVITRWEE